MACLSKAPERRPATADALAQALAEAQRADRDTPSKILARPTVTLLRSARRPCLLIATRVGSVELGRLGALAAEHHAIVARQHEGVCVLAMADLEDASPARGALDLAAAIQDRLGAACVVHVATLTTRTRPDGTWSVYGPEVEHPERWMPAGPIAGVVLTDALAETLPDAGTRVAVDAVTPRPCSLHGRSAELLGASASLTACQAARGPALLSIVGAAGVGKSRLLAECADLVPAGTIVRRYALLRLGDRADDLLRLIRSELPGLLASGPVALLVDDVHLASDATLDALEYAALDAPSPLWIVVTATPRLHELRPRWGASARRHDLLSLAALDARSAVDLLGELLLPAEYCPVAVRERLVAWAGGNPRDLTELVRVLARSGVIRQKASGAWYVAEADLERLPASTVGQWLAEAELARLPDALAALVRVCAVLGQGFDRAEVEAVQDRVEREGGATSPVDASVGLGELVRLGLLLPQPEGRFAFGSSTFQDGLYRLLARGDRERLHRHAFGYWQQQSRARAALARHAEACGELLLAARTHLALAEEALSAHRASEAERLFGQALAHLADPGPERLLALLGRGRVRYRLWRPAEALVDLGEARALAGALGDRTRLADVLLEEATALDWAHEYAGSARRVEEAAALIRAGEDPRLDARVLLGRGRALWRSEDAAGAAQLLGRAHRAAAGAGDVEAQVIALLLLGCALAVLEELDASEAAFAEVIDTCTRTGDALHLSAAHGNRLFLWVARKQPERGLADLRIAIQLARDVGQPHAELAATYNLAELLYRGGALDEALELARRSHALAERVVDKPLPEDPLLVARIQLVRGDREDARRQLAWIAGHCPDADLAPGVLVQLEMMALALAGDPADVRWEALMERVRTALGEDGVAEALQLRALVPRAVAPPP
jgi:tetratricopeptide (TPR) repeat protein